MSNEECWYSLRSALVIMRMVFSSKIDLNVHSIYETINSFLRIQQTKIQTERPPRLSHPFKC